MEQPAAATLPVSLAPARRSFYSLRLGLGALWLLVPAAAEFWLDLSRRRPFLSSFDRDVKQGYALSWLGSTLLVAVLVTLAAYPAAAATYTRRRRVLSRVFWHGLLIAFAILAVGAQSYTFARYQAYMDDRAVLLGTALLPSIGQQLWHDRMSLLAALGVPLLYALTAPFVLRALWGSRGSTFWSQNKRRAARDVFTAVLLLTFFSHSVDSQQALPSSLYVHAMGQYSRARWDHNETVERVHPGHRHPAKVPALVAAPSAPRNVVFVLTESVRADAVCSEYSEHCEVTPFTNQALPTRLPFLNVRALGSTTAMSISTMWSGLPPESSREDTHKAPLIWEYAKAAKMDGAYFTAQNLLFGNSGVWLEAVPFTKQFSATHLEPDPPLEVGAKDSLLFAQALKDMAGLKEPYLAVLHLSNTHYPYRFPDADAPFQPESDQTGPYYKHELTNRYKDAVYHQDRGLAEFVQGLRARPEGQRTVIVFVSDHAEQLHEHGAHGHTGTLFDTEIRVPAWIDAPPGTLSEAERQTLVSLKNVPLTTLDVFPTLMDLLGLWNGQDLGSYRGKITGQSLLRGGSPPTMAHVLTNCSGLWACAFKNWGAMRGNRKVFAMQGDQGWRCFDTDFDPTELKTLPLEECADLIPVAETLGRPF